MKRIFLFACSVVMLALTQMGNAQEVQLITRLPNLSNGFIILNKWSYPDIDHWIIEVSNVNTDENGLITETVVYRKKLWGINYDYISSGIYNGNSIFHVTGYDANGNVVVDDKNDSNGTGPVEKCHIVCDGPDYVYQLTSYDIPNGGYDIKMEIPSAPPAGLDYYYEWFASSDFNSNGPNAPQNPTAHGMNNFIYTDPINLINNYIIKRTGVPAYQPYHNRFGEPVYGDLYGVMKYFGPYVGYPYSSPDLSYDVCDAFESIETVLDYMNLNENNPKEMTCEGREVHTAEAADPGDVTFEPCIKEYYDILGGIPSIFHFAQIFQIPCDEYTYGEGGFTGANGFDWPESIPEIVVWNLDDDSAPNGFNRSDFFDEEGNYVGKDVTLSKGLLRITYVFADGYRKDAFVFNSEENTSSLTQADFVTYTAYPNPIIDDNFTLRLISSQRVSFKYELRDQFGTLLYGEQYDLEKNKQLDDLITSDKPFSSGIYFNKLIFADNSEITFQIVK